MNDIDNKIPALCLNCGKWFFSSAMLPECQECKKAGVLYSDCCYIPLMLERSKELISKINDLQCRLNILVRERGQTTEQVIEKAKRRLS